MGAFLINMMNPAGFVPPRACQETFNLQFANAVRIEWFEKKNHLEAIFYQNSLEHIACYEPDGHLMNYKMFLPKELLPQSISAQLYNRGEIMNVVLLNNGHSIQYEIIITESDLQRHMILFSATGVILKEERL
jgi:hypothetical protein